MPCVGNRCLAVRLDRSTTQLAKPSSPAAQSAIHSLQDLHRFLRVVANVRSVTTISETIIAASSPLPLTSPITINVLPSGGEMTWKKSPPNSAAGL